MSRFTFKYLFSKQPMRWLESSRHSGRLSQKIVIKLAASFSLTSAITLGLTTPANTQLRLAEPLTDCNPGTIGCPTPYPGVGAYSQLQGNDNAYAVFIGGDFTVQGSVAEAEGGIFIYNDFNMNKDGLYNMGWVGVGSYVIPDDQADYVTVGGNVSIPGSNGRIDVGGIPNNATPARGNFRHKGTISGPGNIQVIAPGQIIADPALDLAPFDAVFSRLQTQSSCLATKANSPNVTVDYRGYEVAIESTDGASGVYIVNIDRDIDNNSGSNTGIAFRNFPNDATIIVNVNKAGSADNIAIRTYGVTGTGATEPVPPQLRERILWNFPDAQTVTFDGSAQFEGSILIPNRNSNTLVRMPGMNGRFIAGGDVIHDSTSGAEFHNYPFRGTLPTDCDTPLPTTDFGDAPDTYGTTAASGGPSHNIVSGLQLGTEPDSENDAATPLDGSGDGAEDDGITLATLTEGDTSYTIPAGDIAATGTGTLHAWLDFDKSGTFEPGEYTSVGVTSGTPAGDLAWSGITAGAAGDTYARFRFTSDASITASTPGGAASDGEVEDYLVAIAPNNQFACPRAFFQIINNQLKKLDPLTGQYLNVGSPVVAHYNATGYNPVDDFIYGYGRGSSINNRLVKIAQDGTLTNLGIPTKVGGVGTLSDAHSGDFDDSGNLWLRTSNSGARIYRLDVTTNEYVGFALSQSLTDAQNVADWVYLNGKLYGGFGKTLYIIDLSNQTLGTTLPVTTVSVPGLPANAIFGAGYTDSSNNLYLSHNAGALYQVLNYDTPTPTAIRLVNTISTSFNDGMSCPDAPPPFDVDFGDAPDPAVGNGTDDYSTLLSDSGPFHIVDPNLHLGSGVTADTDGFSDGTDSNGDASDDTDDAFSSLSDIPLTGTYDLTGIPVNNANSTTATLHAWIDFDKNGQFTDSEYQSVSTPQGTTSVDLSWAVPGGTTAGTTYARFRLTSDSALTDVAGTTGVDERSVGLASGGEVEDYQVTIASAPVSTGPTFQCDGEFYIAIGDAATPDQQLYHLDRSTDPYTFNPIGNPTNNTFYSQGFTYNGIALNINDGYIYGIIDATTGSPYDVGSIVRINANGDVTNLGVPQPAGGNPDNALTLRGGPLPEGHTTTTVNYSGGGFSADGTYVLVTDIGSSIGRISEIYTIDINTSPPTITRQGILNGHVLNDLIINPLDPTPNRLYALSENANRLVYIDITNPAAGGTNATSAGTGLSINYGSQFMDAFGTVYFRSATTSSLYRLDATGAAQLITSAPTGGFHDGTSCQGIDITKNVSTTDPVPAGENVTYTYQVANASTSPVTMTFSDDLRSVSDQSGTAADEGAAPVNGTYAGTGNVTLTNATGTPALSNSDQTLTISDLTIPSQTVATITAQVTIPLGATPDTYYNQAVLSSLPSIYPATLLSDYFPGTIFREPTPVEVIATSSDPNLLLVERITAINRGQVNEQLFDTTYEDVTAGVANLADNYTNWPTPINPTSGISEYLAGVINRSLDAGDEVEYTIYFISSGAKPLTNVRICDMVPPNTTYVSGSMELSYNGATTNLSDTGADSDGGEFVSSPTVPTTPCPEPTNEQGAVVVTVAESPDTVPNATAPGLPSDSYGYVRFRVTVD